MAMSKLDFITILIVAICVGALGFLVYKTVKLMNPDETTTEVIDNSNTNYDPADEYALDDEGEVVSDDTPEAEGSTDNNSTPTVDEEEYPVADDAGDLDDEEDPEPAKTPEKTTPDTYDGGSESGQYLVLAGSYKQKINATNQVNKLKKLGYDDAAVKIFNGGALAVALVDRFDTYSEANSLKKELESKGFDVFIKKK